MRIGFLIIIALFVTSAGFAQKTILTLANSDCKGAIDISGKTQITATAPISAGKVNEISSHRGDIYYFQKEHFTVWYTFAVEEDALLSFVITPNKSTDDYDFILFECNTNDCCNGVNSRQITPLRTNISRTKAIADGITGLNTMAVKKYVHEGKGDNFSKAARVYKGRKYILLLDNVYGGDGGHTISFDYEALKPKKEITDKTVLNLNIIEKGKSDLIGANIMILHYDKDYTADTIIYDNKSSLFFPLIPNDFYEIRVTKDEFLYQEISIKPKAEDTIITKTVELVKASKGTSFDLKKLYFRGGTAQFTGNYKSTLMKLQRSMKENPSLKIVIRGHVNRPNGSYKHKSEEYYNTLSIDRAKAVYNYLIKRGIAQDRLMYEGVGYAEMVYPDASSQSEMQKNRRVEVVVTEF